MERVVKTEKLLALWNLGRPRNALPTLLAFLTGVAVVEPSMIFSTTVCVTSLSLVIINIVLTLQNDVYDIQVDRTNKYRSSLLVGLFTEAQLKDIIRYGLLCCVSLPLIVRRFDVAFALSILIALGIAYNCPPYQGSRRPIASLAILSLVFSALSYVLGVYVAGGAFNVGVVLMGLAFYFYRWSASIMKDYKDVAGDTKHAKRTFLVAYGPKRTRRVSIVTAVVGCAGIVGFMLYSKGLNSLAMVFALGVVVCCALVAVAKRWQLSNNQSRFDKNHSLFQSILLVQIALELGVLLWFYLF